MSHYTVGVILPKHINQDEIEKNVAEALAPFNESLEVEPYIMHTKEELLKQYEEYKQRNINEKKGNNSSEILNLVKGDLDMPDPDIYNFEDFVTLYLGYDIDKDGNALSTYNPNSKWDWYSIGGRWSELIEVKNAPNCNFARIKDIIFEKEFCETELFAMKKSYKKLITEGDFYKPEYYQKRYPDFEAYIKDRNLSTFAILDVNGNWMEPGKMGWFGMSSSTPEEERAFAEKYLDTIKSCDEDDWFVVVDCHI